jgi:hypothetical protein
MGRMNTKQKITRSPIDENELIKVWARVFREGGGLQDVADELGCSYAGAKNKSERLIEDGVKLPELKKGRRSKVYDVAALNAELKTELAKGK